jgi:hypothetical protein
MNADAVFFDTVGLLALWDESDQWHSAADGAFAALQAAHSAVITTSFVLLECGNAAARRPYRQTVNRLRPNLSVAGALIYPTHDDWENGWDAFQRGEADNAGIVDQVSFVVMKRLGLTRAFTNDRHFRAAGLVTLF